MRYRGIRILTATAPAAQTGKPTVEGTSTASFTGAATPNGNDTTVYFEYGLDPKYTGGGTVVYDQSTPDQDIGSGISPQTVNASAADLDPDALYHVRLVATNSYGTTYGADETFMTEPEPPPPAPVLDKTADAGPVSGEVLIHLPTGAPRVTLPGEGGGYVPLTELSQLPSGTSIDTRHGTISLETATGAGHQTGTGTFTGAVFQISLQSGAQKGITQLTLDDGAFSGVPSYNSVCKAHAARDRADPSAIAAALNPAIIQTLHAHDNHGSFRTRGKFSAGTVRGTTWDTIDRCDGTGTIVYSGVVDVYDYHTGKTTAVYAGHHFLVTAS